MPHYCFNGDATLQTELLTRIFRGAFVAIAMSVLMREVNLKGQQHLVLKVNLKGCFEIGDLYIQRITRDVIIILVDYADIRFEYCRYICIHMRILQN